MKILLIILFVLLALVLVVLGGYLLTGWALYRFSLSRQGKLKRGIEIKNKCELKKRPEIEKYFNKDDFKKLTITSTDDLKLYGFYKDSNKDRLAILVHGYGGNHTDMYSIAQLFEERGYDILSFDQRAHGESEGEGLSMGLYEHRDLLLWINKMLELKPNYKIVLFGISMGASTVCMALGENLPNNVICGIEDCGYDNANNEFILVYSKSKIKSRFIYNIFYNYTKNTKGLDLKKVDACDYLRKSKLPMLFIHGDLDDFVPTKMVYNLYNCLPEQRRQLYIAKDAKHTRSIDVNLTEYKRQLFTFLDKYYM